MNNLKKNDKLQRRAKRLYALCVCLALTMVVFIVPAFAAPAGGDPLDVVNNLSEFIFSLIRAVGLILLGYGILQVGLPSSPTIPPSAPTVCSPSRAAL